MLFELPRQMVITLERRVDSCWFTVRRSSHAARALHDGLGAVELETRRSFYVPGDDRLVLRIDPEAPSRQWRRYHRLGVPARATEASAIEAGGVAC